MKKILGSLLIIVFLFSCEKEKEVSSINQKNWDKRRAVITQFDSLKQGKTYLPLYSQIYHNHEHKSFDLTVTVSIRNVSPNDSIYILKAEYFNTKGQEIREYFQKPIFLKPLETIEIIIDEEDKEGGSGANFIFDWAVKKKSMSPLFEAVMISTYGQQGLSFSTRGIEIVE
ncbi:DUF3124 domain-containing protein [Labilibaculum sp.]|uniref:DUF3124 domain-containing protein n=1 Tax=Labilibaculum sp. TaxID=2060723 RepID=UPI003566DD8A